MGCGCSDVCFGLQGDPMVVELLDAIFVKAVGLIAGIKESVEGEEMEEKLLVSGVALVGKGYALRFEAVGKRVAYGPGRKDGG
ncbi:hypothetical protein SLEP1_g40541 [Rubroshorea leprosula]|uniref:Uncharacterized protein n=1 Tax=Rubroshorea leprosula TaxID=152421 RepID=A0AAV5L4L1_9ROSI|nr:hypothetical protein SLEP1_g40541 [Rubroshorea leprosula]